MPKRTDGNHAEIRDALRKAGFVVADTHTMGYGFPDLTVRAGCHVLLFEVKMPGERLNETEKTFHTAWDGAGVYVVNTAEQAIRIAEGWQAWQIWTR